MRWNPPVELSPLEAKLCKRHEKNRRFFRFARLHRHEIFNAEMQDKLIAMYSDKPRGTPPKPPARLAMAVLLQAYTGQGDAAVIEECEFDTRWQMVLDCVGWESAPFSESTLVEFRRRLVESGTYLELLRRTVALAKESGDYGYKQAAALRIALDSVPLEGAGKVEDTINLLGHALRLLVVVVASHVGVSYEQLLLETDLSVLQAKSVKAGLSVDWDASDSHDVALRLLLSQCDAFEAWWSARKPKGMTPRAVDAAQAVLAHIRQQNVVRDDGGNEQLREGVAPDRQISLSDPDMRHGRKHETQRIDGYKKYLAVDQDTGLVVAAAVLPANVAEAKGADKLQNEIERYGTVRELAIDRAFLSSELTQQTHRRGDDVICRALHPKNGTLFSKDQFEVNLIERTVRCPAGKLAKMGAELARFSATDCNGCVLRVQCQKPGATSPRGIAIAANEELLQELARKEKTEQGRAKLRERTSIEHINSHHARRQGPVARYLGIAKNDFDVVRISAVQNLLELDRRERLARARVPELREVA